MDHKSKKFQKLNFIKKQILCKNQICDTIIEVARLSSKEKALVHDRGRNFDPIVTKLGTNEGVSKIQVEFVDELCGANKKPILSLKDGTGRNFDPIVFKHGTEVCLI